MSSWGTARQADYVCALVAKDFAATLPILRNRFSYMGNKIAAEASPAARLRMLRGFVRDLRRDEASALIDALKQAEPLPPPPVTTRPASVLDAATLKGAAALTHPDRHPPERREQATKITALLNAARDTASAL